MCACVRESPIRMVLFSVVGFQGFFFKADKRTRLLETWQNMKPGRCPLQRCVVGGPSSLPTMRVEWLWMCIWELEGKQKSKGCLLYFLPLKLRTKGSESDVNVPFFANLVTITNENSYADSCPDSPPTLPFLVVAFLPVPPSFFFLDVAVEIQSTCCACSWSRLSESSGM